MIVKQKITEYLCDNSLAKLSQETRVDPRQIKLLLQYDPSLKKFYEHKFTQRILDNVYDFFEIEKDEFYKENLKKRYKPTEAILGNIFRKKRIQMGWTLEDVAYRIKGDERQLRRIESGDSLPSYKSYYITQLINLYNFSQHEEEIIRWFICILSDMLKINSKYDLENVVD